VVESEWVVPDETGWREGGHGAWLHTLVRPKATAYVIDPTRSGAVAEAILGLNYDGTMIHDGWSPYDQFADAHHQQCLNHLLRRADDMAATATRGAVCFPRRVAELLRAGLDLRDRHAAGEVSQHGLAVARGRLENRLSDLIFPPKMNAANERLAQHLWAHRDDLFTFLRQPGLDATNWRAELAIRFGVILRKVWGGNRTWAVRHDDMLTVLPADNVPVHAMRALQPLVEEFARLGARLAFFQSVPATENLQSYAAVLLPREPDGIVVIAWARARISRPDREGIAVCAITSRLQDGTFLSTTNRRSRFDRPPEFRVLRWRSANPDELSRRHKEALEKSGTGAIPVRDERHAHETLREAKQRNFEWNVSRGVYVPLTSAEQARLGLSDGGNL